MRTASSFSCVASGAAMVTTPLGDGHTAATWGERGYSLSFSTTRLTLPSCSATMLRRSTERAAIASSRSFSRSSGVMGANGGDVEPPEVEVGTSEAIDDPRAVGAVRASDLHGVDAGGAVAEMGEDLLSGKAQLEAPPLALAERRRHRFDESGGHGEHGLVRGENRSWRAWLGHRSRPSLW